MRLFPTSIGTLHFVGIGGIGMSGIAEILNNLGYNISGSDIKQSTLTKRLERLGIHISYEHKPENVVGASVVVVSSSIRSDNPELQKARELKIPVIKRAEMLGELMRLKKSVAVAGTHGKTTTTSLVANLFDCADLSPTVVNGGIINSYGSNARLGTGEWIVVEADESDGSFNKLPPTIAVVTNIDEDHMENFNGIDDLRSRFLKFVESIPFYGVGVLCSDHYQVKKLENDIIDKRIISYGFNKDADVIGGNVRIENGETVFDVNFSKRLVERYQITNSDSWKNFRLRMVGVHNVLNALSVIAIAIELKIDIDVVRKSFLSFLGVNRRFTKIGEINGASVIDDYGHHPVEIDAVLKAARSICNGRLVVVMQPHRYSRLKMLLSEFADSLMPADRLYITEVYSAGEEPNGVDHNDLIEKITAQGHNDINTAIDFEKLKRELYDFVTSQDMIIFLGAGSISSIAHDLMKD